MLEAPCSDLPGSHLPSAEAAAPRSDHWCQNPLEAAAVKNRPHCLVGICPALACGTLASAAWASAAVSRPVLVAVAADSYLAPAVVLAAVRVCFGPACGFAGNCHRAVECSGYTWASPGERKIDSLGSQNRSCDLCHSGGPHGVFQLMDPLAA